MGTAFSRFTTFPVDNWYDCGKKEILLATNAALLKKFSLAAGPEAPRYENTIIIHPVSIADECNISNSITGPNVSVGKGAVVERSIVSDSIIGSHARIVSAVLHHSVVGGEASIKGLTQSLNIGDSTEIDFS